MAINLNNISNKRSSRNRKNAISDINITPLVDVMLVLLIIFMVTSPMLVAGINVDLPETESSPIAGQDEPLTITINAKGDVYLVDNQINLNDLSAKLIAITKEKYDTRIFVRGDVKASYGKVVEVVGELNAAGFSKVALITNIKHHEK